MVGVRHGEPYISRLAKLTAVRYGWAFLYAYYRRADPNLRSQLSQS